MYIPGFQMNIPGFQMYITAIILLLTQCINAADLRFWEIIRENGNKELCCFCSSQSLITGEHVIPECKEKLGKMSFHGYFGSPICSCLSSQKYPQCSSNETVCGHNIECPKRKVYKNCRINELLTEEMMSCNDSLKWDYDIDCKNTCTQSNKIENGDAFCMKFGNRVVCNVTCQNGFHAAETENLSCAEAKDIACSALTKAYAKIGKILSIIIPICFFLIIVGILLYFKYRNCWSCFPVNHTDNFEMVQHANGQIASGQIANGQIANGQIANGQIGRCNSYDSHRANSQIGECNSYDSHRANGQIGECNSYDSHRANGQIGRCNSYDSHRGHGGREINNGDEEIGQSNSCDSNEDSDGPRGRGIPDESDPVNPVEESVNLGRRNSYDSDEDSDGPRGRGIPDETESLPLLLKEDSSLSDSDTLLKTCVSESQENYESSPENYESSPEIPYPTQEVGPCDPGQLVQI